jgi:hypothetical protein
MRPSLLRSCGVSLLLLGIVGCGGGDNTKADGGAGHAGGSGGKSGTGGGAGQGAGGGGAAGSGAVTGGGGAAGSGAVTGGGGTAGAGTAGAAGGGAVDAGLDLGGIAPPASMTASVKVRRQTLFELVWTAPSINGAAVTSYQVRYAKVPITTANFDDTTVTTVIPNSNTPKAPGMTDGMDVQLYIENAYYFAVEGEIAGGTRSPIDATTTAVAAHFEVATLSGTSGSSTEGAGFALDGSGDANGDRKSDILMGSYNGLTAYLFFGAAGFSPTAPSVVFTSATAGFGRGVAFIGDIDHDGREDLAIANRSTEVIYIYRGRATWPMTLTDAQADFTITADASYASSLFGAVMTRLGDFDGDGIDDFAIGSPNFNSTNLIGRVTVIKGASGFASLTLPSATGAIIIDGDSTLVDGGFGASLAAINPFYSNASTLVVSAPGFVGAPSGTAGRIYAFRGQTGTAGAIPVGSADAVVTGATAGMRIGAVLTDLGILSGGIASVGSGNPNDTTAPVGGGSIFVYSGNTTAGPFMSEKTLYFTGASLVGAQLIGGGTSGRNVSYSLIGDATPDLVVVPRNGGTLGILDGAKLSGLTSPIDVAAKADVVTALPSTWGPPAFGIQSIVPDVDGDGYPDFAISDGASTLAGQALIYH